MDQNKNNCQCLECGLEYKSQKWADKCAKWCARHKNYHLDILKHALEEHKLCSL